MKTSITLLLLVFNVSIAYNQDLTIPDTNFLNKLLQTSPDKIWAQDLNSRYVAVDSNGDGIIQLKEAENISSLYLGWSNIKSLKGISYFKNLRELNCVNNELDSLDVSLLPELTWLVASNNKLSYVKLNDKHNLKYLYLKNNRFTKLDLSGQESLELFYCGSNQLTELNLKGCDKLVCLGCGGNRLKELDLTNKPQLQRFFAHQNQLARIYLMDGIPNHFEDFYINLNTDSLVVCIDKGDDFDHLVADDRSALSSRCKIIEESDDEMDTTTDTISRNTESPIVAYPNPASDHVRFSETIVQLNIYDITGKLHYSEEINSDWTTIDFLSPGTYLFIVIDQKGRNQTLKLVKM